MLDPVKLLADVVVGRQPPDAEQRAAGAFAVGLVEHALVIQERGRLDVERRKRARSDVIEAVCLLALFRGSSMCLNTSRSEPIR